jgi:Zn-dependent peptidase ImmA (M78 family)
MRVPWLPKRRIAHAAERVIADYESMIGQKLAPPIPVEDIIEKYFQIRLGAMDFETELGMKGVLGATYVEARVICVDESLFQSGCEGRFTFTCAHEVGHWVLHRRYVEEAKRSGSEEIAIICRLEKAKEPIEWQADYFASSLLMPEDVVRKTFYQLCGRGPLILENVGPMVHSSSLFIEPCVKNWPLIAEAAIYKGGFENVSKQAMVIRLQDLGLLINNTTEALGWPKAASGLEN